MDTCISQYNFSRQLLAGAADSVLVTAAKSGDQTAFAPLWERHSNRVFRSVYRITRNRDDAEEVLQEAWMKAYPHVKTFENRASFVTWITRIAINSALMVLRRKRTHPETTMEFYDGETWRSVDVATRQRTLQNSSQGTKAHSA